jgi:hypothetical protein
MSDSSDTNSDITEEAKKNCSKNKQYVWSGQITQMLYFSNDFYPVPNSESNFWIGRLKEKIISKKFSTNKNISSN